MNDFFGALELELRAAGERRLRRRVGAGPALGALAAAALVAIAVLLVTAVAGGGGGDTAHVTGGATPDPVGTVIPKGEGAPPRPARSTVVATGSVKTGAWQLEAYRGHGLKDPETGEVYEPAGLRCLMLFQLERFQGPAASGFCGPFPRTPGFSRAQTAPPDRAGGGQRRDPPEILVYGRTPERAAAVVITAPGGARIEGELHEGPRGVRGDFYVIPVKPGLGRARIDWLDADGKPGSRGIPLMPPIAP